MVSTKDLRDMFSDLTNQASKRAGEAIKSADLPDFPDFSNIGRRSEPPGLLWFGIGLTLGAVIGLLAAFLATPYNGEQARKKLGEQVEKVRKSREDDEIPASTKNGNGSSTYTAPTASAFERS